MFGHSAKHFWEACGCTVFGYAAALAVLLVFDMEPTWAAAGVIGMLAVAYWVVSLFHD